jgi:hypothetical protein
LRRLPQVFLAGLDAHQERPSDRNLAIDNDLRFTVSNGNIRLAR